MPEHTALLHIPGLAQRLRMAPRAGSASQLLLLKEVCAAQLGGIELAGSGGTGTHHRLRREDSTESETPHFSSWLRTPLGNSQHSRALCFLRGPLGSIGTITNERGEAQILNSPWDRGGSRVCSEGWRSPG